MLAILYSNVLFSSCGSLVFSIEKLKAFPKLAAFLEFNLLIVFGTGLLFCITQKTVYYDLIKEIIL